MSDFSAKNRRTDENLVAAFKDGLGERADVLMQQPATFRIEIYSGDGDEPDVVAEGDAREIVKMVLAALQDDTIEDLMIVIEQKNVENEGRTE